MVWPMPGPGMERRTGTVLPAVDRDLGDEGELDLRIFWGPEYCRLEYLVETGRVRGGAEDVRAA